VVRDLVRHGARPVACGPGGGGGQAARQAPAHLRGRCARTRRGRGRSGGLVGACCGRACRCRRRPPGASPLGLGLSGLSGEALAGGALAGERLAGEAGAAAAAAAAACCSPASSSGAPSCSPSSCCRR
jgi:hypothetical protein